MIDPGIFRTLQVPLLRGRQLSGTDLSGRHRVAVVNQALVAKFFPDQDPIGKQLHITTLQFLPEPLNDPWFQIVGVVADFKNRGVLQPVLPAAYIPYTLSGLGGFSLILRTSGNPLSFSRLVEGTVLSLDGSAVMRHVRTLQQGLEDETYAKPRFGLEIFSLFALLGLVLASAGLYSVMAYAVSQREREIGIRVAIGASASQVQLLVVRSGMRSVALGIGTGLLASFVLLNYLRSQLWGITTYDPLTLASVVFILVIAGLAGCYLPSLTALRVDPALTLRAE